MNASHDYRSADADPDGHDNLIADTTTPAERRGTHTMSMHDGVSVWCDCCSCEAEPYWVAIGEESSIRTSGNHEASRTDE